MSGPAGDLGGGARALRTWGPKGLPVPYVARWSGEPVTAGGRLTVRPDGRGLAYRDETPADRDRHGVLWARMVHAPGAGRPDYRVMHPARQRRAMGERLCQVCGREAGRTGKGWLFLMRRPEAGDEVPGWPEGLLCRKPPVCAPCAEVATRHCPHLEPPVFVRCRKPRVWGVFGGAFTPGPRGGLVAGEDGYLPYGHPAAPWFLGNQLVVELTRTTRVPEP
ncbi:hypothetical protein [Streptomyces hoynatensis]|uniref:Uncharacterized protein n=1 Tax=Streptomyces hoynatensis TaxID=1141874 RepID=A0A3A9YQU6_9ACTN|nr:hypothetical protein [Streptomyces hoynatensis]RKN38330.1 hypothetical protein D7294_24770 [Streptomyces hoynatensis]